MGGAITRKAIMGGRCVENNEDLGPPLTNIVRNYLGVIGVVWGAALCDPDTGVWKNEQACNNLTGMICGSKFLRDVNSK